MANNPNVNYIYPQANYYFEKPESYAADYSENEIVPESQQVCQAGPHTNITEIYTRKGAAMALQTQMIPNETRFRPKHYLQPCYCENAHQLPGTHIAVPIQNYEQTFDPPTYHQNRPVSTPSQIDTNFDPNPYRSRSAHQNISATHHPNHAMSYPNAHQNQKQQNVKRHLIKVGTPKYYRKSPANAIFKRPSALCLPVASQPDPASNHRRPRKSSTSEIHYDLTQQDIVYNDEAPGAPLLLKEPSQPDLMAHKMDSEGDVNTNISNLDDILNQFETGTERLKPKSRCDLAKFARFMKPRVPISIKEKHEKSKFKASQLPEMVQSNFIDRDANEIEQTCTRLDVQEVTEDSLEKLLNQLKKCELEDSFDKKEMKDDIRTNLGHERRKELDSHKIEIEKTEVTDEEESKTQKNQYQMMTMPMAMAVVMAMAKAMTKTKTQTHDEDEENEEDYEVDDESRRDVTSTNELLCKGQAIINKAEMKSFNYQDITNQILRSHGDPKCFEDSVDSTAQSSIQDITKRISSSVSGTNSSQKPKNCIAKHPMDDHCALELHRSKSYIVNLIDRALSKELGTVPNDRSQREFGNMNPRRAIDMMTRHSCGKADDLCLEITSALTDSIISNATAPESRPTTATQSRNKICCCNEEPTYIKQLKQLRWGHLKHIQREVRRLEDLERFLDSCSLNTISEF